MALIDHPSSDWAAPVVLTVVAWRPLNLVGRLAAVPVDGQRAVFASSATVVSITAGFTVSAIFFFAATEAPTIEAFRDEFGRLLNRSLIGAFVALVLSVCLLVASLLAAPEHVAALTFIFATTLAAIKLCRVAYLGWAMLEARYRDTRLRSVAMGGTSDGAP